MAWRKKTQPEPTAPPAPDASAPPAEHGVITFDLSHDYAKRLDRAVGAIGFGNKVNAAAHCVSALRWMVDVVDHGDEIGYSKRGKNFVLKSDYLLGLRSGSTAITGTNVESLTVPIRNWRGVVVRQDTVDAEQARQLRNTEWGGVYAQVWQQQEWTMTKKSLDELEALATALRCTKTEALWAAIDYVTGQIAQRDEGARHFVIATKNGRSTRSQEFDVARPVEAWLTPSGGFNLPQSRSVPGSNVTRRIVGGGSPATRTLADLLPPLDAQTARDIAGPVAEDHRARIDADDDGPALA